MDRDNDGRSPASRNDRAGGRRIRFRWLMEVANKKSGSESGGSSRSELPDGIAGRSDF